MATPEKGWYYVPPGGQPLGPFDEKSLQGFVVGGQIDVTTCVWREGCDSWLPIAHVDELKEVLEAALASTHVKKSASKRKKPLGPADADLDAFKAEIEALESTEKIGENAEADYVSGLQEGEAPASPDEKEFEDDDGTWYIWSSSLRKFVPRELTETVATAYEDMVFIGEEEVIPTVEAAKAAEAAQEAALEAALEGRGAKRQKGEGKQFKNKEDAGALERIDSPAPVANHSEPDNAHEADKDVEGKKGSGKGQAAPKQSAAWFDLKVNTSVYVTGLPEDVTQDEMVQVFSKYGVIKEDERAQPRIKIYKDKATGMPKGDALVTYLKEPSVNLAIQMLDQTPFRFGMGTNMSVSMAKFEMKGEAFQPKQSNAKKNKKAQLEKLEKRLAWGGFDDKQPADKVTVILKHMFTPDEFLENFMLAEELESDVRAECGKLGAVEKLRLFKSNPEGVISIKFKDAEAAQKCITLMNGRWFGGRQLVAQLYDGVTNYAHKVVESWEEQEARLEKFAAELEAQEAEEAKQETMNKAS
ncbi:hypothetical protein CEUSTIGMA_g5050.t1 [Chlamydomonas eustigma]|uniref:RRM domain-containing protein n=1 Tax=Chlamydomonas eustigma TaxID=1157962 RepID=A0A250X3H5_9CHLO|nr:hypothetical protein CEUSTIGMA_g5050.t1 [Chlamydomonas eustigma]|eukprot:GAX77606.1 hypothetical protein CEUSTIGMA_g5050.t1 [Chlamydomonas eustigma]